MSAKNKELYLSMKFRSYNYALRCPKGPVNLFLAAELVTVAQGGGTDPNIDAVSDSPVHRKYRDAVNENKDDV